MSRVAALLLSVALPFAALADPHPLDPLSGDEIAAAVAALVESGRTDRTTRVSTVALAEPDKDAVLRWRAGDPVGRRAFAVLRVEGETVEAEIDLSSGRLDRWDVIPGVQPAIRGDEWAAAQASLKQHAGWRNAMRARGYEAFDEIFCESLSAGYFGQANGRIIRMPCYDVAGATSNVYGRPIEGVVATVDLDTLEVVDLIDTGIVPVGRDPHAFDTDSSSVPASLQPLPPQTFNLAGRMVTWRAWRFHAGFDPRFGPVLSLVSFEDGGERRPVLYQGHVSEVFVPYMDPDLAWAFRTYMDAGEYGLGTLSSELAAGIDCPDGAAFLDAVLPTATGGARTAPQRVCIFERATHTPMWRHAEALNGVHAGRPGVELVVRAIPSVAHYDYVIDWVFAPSGEIRVLIGATGIDAVKGVAARSADAAGSEDIRHGTLVAPGLAAIHHDHFFSLRLDMDVDGPNNRFVRETIRAEALPAGAPRRSLWRIEEETVATEGPLRADGSVWSVANTARNTALGHAPGYQIVAHGPVSLLDAEDWPQRRAAFSAANLWVTARRPGELYAAGGYPNQSRGDDGLPEYSNGERLDGDLVVWPTIGFRHVTRPEDWPVLSTVWKGISLRPYKFFDRNPSVPPSQTHPG